MSSFLTDTRPPIELLTDLLLREQRIVGVNDSGRVVGEGHHRAKLSDHDCWLICDLKGEGLSYRQIAVKFDVSRETIVDICKGRRRGQTATGQRVHTRATSVVV